MATFLVTPPQPSAYLRVIRRRCHGAEPEVTKTRSRILRGNGLSDWDSSHTVRGICVCSAVEREMYSAEGGDDVVSLHVLTRDRNSGHNIYNTVCCEGKMLR